MSGRKPGGGHGSASAGATDFLLRAHAMEVEAAERYDEFAAQMELHNNLEVAGLFRKLAGIERKHAESIAADLKSRGIGDALAAPLARPREEGLESASAEALHYLMTPYHALEIALKNEERALAFFTQLLEGDAPKDVRELAEEFAREEANHVELLRQWLARTAKPRADWAYDPDEPHLSE